VPSAVIVRAALPAGLERLRRRRVGNAADGVPAHLTLLHPFIEPNDLAPAVRRRLREVARRHPPFGYRQARMAEWPDAIYVAVQPTDPFRRLHRELQDEFPDWPIYGGSIPDFRFEPHITVADRAGKLEPGVREDAAWRALPRDVRAAAIDVIATRPDGRWRLVWRIRLGE
jgi:2'-5' RNA ligase